DVLDAGGRNALIGEVPHCHLVHTRAGSDAPGLAGARAKRGLVERSMLWLDSVGDSNHDTHQFRHWKPHACTAKSTTEEVEANDTDVVRIGGFLRTPPTGGGGRVVCGDGGARRGVASVGGQHQ